jgi:hypothetical protein
MAEIVSQYRIEVKQAVDALNQVADASEDTGKTVKKASDESAKALSNVKDVASEISPEFGRAAKAMTALRGGVGKIVTAMKTLRGAIIATGVGALVLAVTALVSWFTKTERGAQALRVIMAGFGAVVNTVRDAMIGMVDASIAFLRGDFKGAADAASTAFSGMGTRIVENTRAALELEKAMNRVKVETRELSVETAKSRAEIKALNLLAEDTTKSYEERRDAAKRAFDLENSMMQRRLALAEENLRVIREQNRIAENSEKDFEAEAQAEIALYQIREQSLELQTTLNNKLNIIEQQIAAKRASEAAAQQERIKKETESREKANEERLKKEAETQAAIEKAEAEHVKRVEEIRKGLASLTLAIDEELNTASQDVLRRQIAAIKQTQLERQAVLMQSFQNQLITVEEYEKAAIDADAAAKATIEVAEREHQERLQKIREDAEAKERETRQKNIEESVNEFNQYAQIVQSVYNAISSAIIASYDNELIALQNSLEAGEISQEQYDEKRRQLARQRAAEEKTAAIFNAVISTAMAVASALVPFGPQSPFLAALAGALGAVQIGIIASQPLPQFAEGGWVDGRGMIQGRAHAQGGVKLEAEGGEFIVNRAASAKNAALIEAINKGMGEAYIMRKWVAPAVDAALLNGWQDVGKSADLNGLTATLKDHNIIRAMDRNRETTAYGFKLLADKLNKRAPKRGGYA